MDVAAIIVAAGRGRRLGKKTPKALVRLAGLPMFEHSLKTFSRIKEVEHIVLVIPPKGRFDKGKWRRRYPKLKSIVSGGRERTDSVRAGLAAITGAAGHILIHDAARPLVSIRDAAAVIRAVRRHGAAILAEPVADTVKRAENGFIKATLNRKYLWRAQTPQGFNRRLLERICRLPTESATDDSSLAEALGARVAVVPASGPNFKITTRTDLEIASCLLAKAPSA
jgi:2-C-methyl-D-erythritol 4-phosphate cytidylyltransferase